MTLLPTCSRTMLSRLFASCRSARFTPQPMSSRAFSLTVSLKENQLKTEYLFGRDIRERENTDGNGFDRHFFIEQFNRLVFNVAEVDRNPHFVEFEPTRFEGDPNLIDAPKEFWDQMTNDYDRDRLHALVQQVQVYFYMAPQTPAEPLKLIDWQILFDAPNIYMRMQHFFYLYCRQQRKAKDRRLKALRPAKVLTEEIMAEEDRRPKMFNRIERNRIRYANTFHLCKHEMLADTPTIAVDMQWLPEMSTKALSRLAIQLSLMYSINRELSNPCRLQFFNMPYQMKWLHDSINEVHGNRATDLPFLKDKQTIDQNYLIADHFEQDVHEIPNVDDIHIIGALCTEPHGPVTLAKARKLGIRHAKLPIDKYVKIETGGKALTLHAILRLILDTMDHGDYKRSLEQHLNLRKLRPFDPVRAEHQKAKRAAEAELMRMLPLVPPRKHVRPLYKSDGRDKFSEGEAGILDTDMHQQGKNKKQRRGIVF